MKLIDKLFKKKTEPVKNYKKLVAVYISKERNQIIIAPYHINSPGIYYEQDFCMSLSYNTSASILGEEIMHNFHLFSFKDKNLRDEKNSNWPAYKCSKMKSLKSFKKAYHPISIIGANRSNIILSVEAPLSSNNNLNITSSISATTDKEAIAECVIKVYNKAITS